MADNVQPTSYRQTTAFWDSVEKDVDFLLKGDLYEAERDEWTAFIAKRKQEMAAPSTLPFDSVCRPSELTTSEVNSTLQVSRRYKDINAMCLVLCCSSQDMAAAGSEEFEGRIRSSHNSQPTYTQLQEQITQKNDELSALTRAHEDLLADYHSLENRMECLAQREAMATQCVAGVRMDNAQLSAQNAGLCARVAYLTQIMNQQHPPSHHASR